MEASFSEASPLLGIGAHWRRRSCPPPVIASDSDAIQTKPRPQSLSLDGFALLAMTERETATEPLDASRFVGKLPMPRNCV